MCKRNVQTGCTGYIYIAAMKLSKVKNKYFVFCFNRIQNAYVLSVMFGHIYHCFVNFQSKSSHFNRNLEFREIFFKANLTFGSSLSRELTAGSYLG